MGLMQPKTGTMREALRLRVGELVEVRSAAEILATLDENGELDNLPFMPEMLQFCGKRLIVHKVAHKLCDTIGASGIRLMTNAVHLAGSRCDGQAHGGCQTGCSLYWKEAWLRRVTADEASALREPAELTADNANLSLLEMGIRKGRGPEGEERFSCQATELLRAAPMSIPLLDLRQYVTDVRTGNVGVSAMLRTFLFGLFNGFQRRSKRLLPSCLLIKGGLNWGFVKGGAVGRTPTSQLDLQPGELVRIKAKEEILKTLDSDRRNRGMGFDEEMARYCGQTARVLRRVDRCIDEKTGRMLWMKNPCIVLDGIVCGGVYHANCPREFLPFWREVWLERVDDYPNRMATEEQKDRLSPAAGPGGDSSPGAYT
jgi:hypothetical protein